MNTNDMNRTLPAKSKDSMDEAHSTEIKKTKIMTQKSKLEKLSVRFVKKT